RAALRAGAGYVRVASHPDQIPLLHATVPEAVIIDALDTATLAEALSDSDALAAGPGLGGGALAGSLEAAFEALPSGARILLDADALTLLASGGLSRWKDRTMDGGSGARLLTPHPGEASTLLGVESSAIVADPLRHARECAHQWDASVLLKGTPSVVASGRPGRVRVSLSGSSEFARAGMGDVLTGVAGALMARGLDAPDAAALALHWTGRAADHLAMGPALLPGDVAEALPLAMSEAGPGTTELSLPFVLLDLPAAH
ncbi:MAG: NAD(P)H-hydrate dehydratase, partial [Gemmatimonadales bacterium]